MNGLNLVTEQAVEMRPVLSREQIRAFDAKWMKAGVPGVVLMENAGRGAAHLIGLKARPRSKERRPLSTTEGSCIRCADERALSEQSFLILCGPGNNGGDGFVVARHLLCRGAQVRTICLISVDRLKGDARLAANSLQALGAVIEPLPSLEELSRALSHADLVIDALLGTGAERRLEGELKDVVEALNWGPTRVISLDIPSGLDASTGAILGSCVRATHTVTFAHLKTGLLTSLGHEYSGTITLSHIGVPAALSESERPAAWLLEQEDLVALLPPKSPTSHKGTAGRVLVVAGSPGMTGAARLVGRACLRAGAGLVTLCGDAETADKLDSEVAELMTHRWGKADNALLGRADSLVVGPGLGRGTTAVLGIEIALGARVPTILDADALRWLGDEGRRSFKALGDRTRFVLTPHPGEAAALLGCDLAEIEAERFLALQKLVDEFCCTVVLKGSRTLIAAPGETPVVCALGSSALGTGGSGDVLSGIMAALLVGARGKGEIFRRVQLAVGVHALSGRTWSEKEGERGLLASEIADGVPLVLKSLQPLRE